MLPRLSCAALSRGSFLCNNNFSFRDTEDFLEVGACNRRVVEIDHIYRRFVPACDAVAQKTASVSAELNNAVFRELPEIRSAVVWRRIGGVAGERRHAPGHTGSGPGRVGCRSILGVTCNPDRMILDDILTSARFGA
jgi:hypothetical protein